MKLDTIKQVEGLILLWYSLHYIFFLDQREEITEFMSRTLVLKESKSFLFLIHYYVNKILKF